MSLRCVLEQDINPSFVLVQPRKTPPIYLKDWDIKDQIKQTKELELLKAALKRS